MNSTKAKATPEDVALVATDILGIAYFWRPRSAKTTNAITGKTNSIIQPDTGLTLLTLT